MTLTPAQQCFLYGHQLELIRAEPHERFDMPVRLQCHRCDIECSEPRVVRQWRGDVAMNEVDSVPQFLMEAMP